MMRTSTSVHARCASLKQPSFACLFTVVRRITPKETSYTIASVSIFEILLGECGRTVGFDVRHDLRRDGQRSARNSRNTAWIDEQQTQPAHCSYYGLQAYAYLIGKGKAVPALYSKDIACSKCTCHSKHYEAHGACESHGRLQVLFAVGLRQGGQLV
mmetsp:Transcript_70482/g.168803  ORF Transcript_70482/g.168803 Transcript_70482/m.168803 type:complete len:157 (-) Transcript_70482:221-691(-)